ncbi:MAG: hypothetical protein V1814_03040 [Candidatus Moraniibacteriota bacterium]
MKANFSSLSQQFQSIILTTPVYTPGTQNPDAETEQQVVERQDRFLKLPKGTRWKLASFEIGNKIELIGQKYGFELLRLANITRLVREYYFGEVRFENFPTEIEKRMGVSLLTAQEITRYLKQEIIDWDPWAEYIASLPKLPIREIVQQYPKIGNTEITSGYIELKGSEDLEDPTIKNWLKDFVSHLGYDRHSQMDRTQYLFHSENGKNLNSQDREKLGIILKSFDEKIPLPVDEENGEIVFDGLMSEPAHPPRAESEMGRQESFIKSYAPVSQPPRQAPAIPSRSREINYTEPVPRPPKNAPQPLSLRPASPQENIHPNLVSQPNLQINSKIDKYFSAPESPDIPAIKIHSITEHNEPRVAPQSAPRPKYKIIDPFFSKPTPEPRIDGNIVDLSEQ